MSNGDVIMMHHGCIMQLFCVGIIITTQDQSARVRQYLAYATSDDNTTLSQSKMQTMVWNGFSITCVILEAIHVLDERRGGSGK